MNETPEVLLERIARGERAALERFYCDHHGRIHAFILQRLRDPGLAAEVLNDVLLAVWRQADRFQGRSRAMTWVLGIAHHKMLDALRRRRRHEAETSLEDAPQQVMDEEADTAAALAALDDAALLRLCLDSLSEAHRGVVHLAFFEDLSYPEIAEIIACPVGTVKTRMMHARQALKRCLRQAEEALGHTQ